MEKQTEEKEIVRSKYPYRIVLNFVSFFVYYLYSHKGSEEDLILIAQIQKRVWFDNTLAEAMWNTDLLMGNGHNIRRYNDDCSSFTIVNIDQEEDELTSYVFCCPCLFRKK